MNDWVRVCTTSELLPGESKVAWDGDTPIVVFNLDGDYYALEDLCSHEDFELSAGCFDAETGTIECVLHGSKFDVRDGRVSGVVGFFSADAFRRAGLPLVLGEGAAPAP